MMRRTWLLLLIAALVVPALAGAAEETTSEEEMELSTQAEKLGYSLGMQIAQSLEQADIEIDINALVRGLTDSLKGDDTLLSSDEAEAVRQEYIQQRQAEMQKKRQEKAQQQKEEAEKFLAENKDKEGVETTDSGLQYKVVEEGTGATPGEDDRVNVNLNIQTIGGRQIFPPENQDEQRTLPVTGLLPGLTEGLKMMQEGSRYKLFVPPELGIQQEGDMTGPGLIIEVELNEVLEGEAAKQKAPAAPEGKANSN